MFSHFFTESGRFESERQERGRRRERGRGREGERKGERERKREKESERKGEGGQRMKGGRGESNLSIHQQGFVKICSVHGVLQSFKMMLQIYM